MLSSVRPCAAGKLQCAQFWASGQICIMSLLLVSCSFQEWPQPLTCRPNWVFHRNLWAPQLSLTYLLSLEPAIARQIIPDQAIIIHYAYDCTVMICSPYSLQWLPFPFSHSPPVGQTRPADHSTVDTNIPLFWSRAYSAI